MAAVLIVVDDDELDDKRYAVVPIFRTSKGAFLIEFSVQVLLVIEL